MDIPAHRRAFVAGCVAALCGLFAGCNGADNPELAKAPPPPPPKEEEKAPTKGKPRGYGTNPEYEKAMEKRFGGGT
jgi:hypothetical protein